MSGRARDLGRTGGAGREVGEHEPREPALSFALRKDGKPRRARVERVSNVAINKSPSVLRAALNLAFKEGLLAEQPRGELLPEDDARPIVPPGDTELNAILDQARAPALLEVAPLLPEVIELAVETGLALSTHSGSPSLGPVAVVGRGSQGSGTPGFRPPCESHLPGS